MPAALKPTPDLVDDVRLLARRGAIVVRFPIYLSYEPSLEAWLEKIEIVPHRMRMVAESAGGGPAP